MQIRRTMTLLIAIVLVGLLSAAWLRFHHSSSAEPAADSSSVSAAATTPRDIYPDGDLAPSQVKAALARAASEKKNVILDFGGNWCGDCKVLDIYFHDPSNLPLLEANYELVHVNIGRYDENQGIANKYGVVLAKGVPALAVLSPEGQVVYSQRNGEFEAMRRMDPSSVTEFLNKWKP